jgi:hypothetical protein
MNKPWNSVGNKKELVFKKDRNERVQETIRDQMS